MKKKFVDDKLDKFEREYKNISGKCQSSRFLSTPLNNKLLLEFIEAKRKGSYGRLLYKSQIQYKTLVKKARNIARIEKHFKKDIDKISEKEMLNYREMLNANKILCYKTTVIWGKKTSKTPKFKLSKTNRPLSYRTKCDYKENFSDFHRFVREYFFQTENRKIPDITKFFQIQCPSDFNEITVEYIPEEDIPTLLENIQTRKFKHMVQLSLMSGARPCEITKVRYGNKYNLYKNSEGKWIIKLPKVKRVSYKKFRFVIDLYEEELGPYFNSLKLIEGDLVFNYTQKTFRKLMKHYTIKYLGKHYSPKILRKSARMIRTNSGETEMFINKLMGHAPGSKVQAHYTNYEGIKSNKNAVDRLKEIQYPSLKSDYEKLTREMFALKRKKKEEVKEVKKEEVKPVKKEAEPVKEKAEAKEKPKDDKEKKKPATKKVTKEVKKEEKPKTSKKE